MCGIGGILRIVKPGEPDFPAGDASLCAASGAWLWHGLDARDVLYARVDAEPHSSSLRPQAASPSWLIPESWLDAIDDHITWRGPDGAGRFRDRVVRADGTIVEVALVHRRLAIIDLEGGAQPMVVTRCPRCAEKAAEPRHQASDMRHQIRDETALSQVPDARCLMPPLSAIVFNGCIYNHRELRAELEAKGHVFASDHSDTEVVLHGWGEWGEHVRANRVGGANEAGRLEGMFAFGVWDRRNVLALGRDAWGEKPLFSAVHREATTLVMASTRVAVESCLGAVCGDPIQRIGSSTASRWSLAAYVRYGWHPDDEINPLMRTVPTGVHEYSADPPSGLRNAVLDRVLLVTFALILTPLVIAFPFLLKYLVSSGLLWLALKFIIPVVATKALRQIRRPALPRLLDQLEHALADSVIDRLEADVPVGCFLSGGVDSSLIGVFAQRAHGSVTTISMRMPDDRYDESRWADRVAEHLGTDHITIDCDAASAAHDLVRIVEMMGRPFGDSSVLPTYWLCRSAAEFVRVALAGDGGDEFFYGYDRYLAARVLPLLSLVAPCLRLKHLSRADPRSKSERRARAIIAARHRGYHDLLAIFPTPDRNALMGRQIVSFDHPVRLQGDILSAPERAQRDDLTCYLPGDLLTKVDTASMMCGLEVRCPFLAPAVADFALSIPARVHMKGGETKHLLKELARKHLPREIVDRPKQGFAIPISDWWRTNFGGLQELLLDSLAGDKPFGRVHDVLEINMGFVRQMLDEHWAAGGLTPLHTTRHVRPRDHGQRLFALVSLAIWSRSIHHRDTESTEQDI